MLLERLAIGEEQATQAIPFGNARTDRRSNFVASSRPNCCNKHKSIYVYARAARDIDDNFAQEASGAWG